MIKPGSSMQDLSFLSSYNEMKHDKVVKVFDMKKIPKTHLEFYKRDKQGKKYSFISVPRHATAILTPVLDLFHTAILFIFAMKERIQTRSKLIVNINVDWEMSKSSLIFTIIFDVVLILSSMEKTT